MDSLSLLGVDEAAAIHDPRVDCFAPLAMTGGARG